tara:strand:- start:16326 stop:18284 length:1959 start_codon:yes stop_codon:yes gene_type:complete
MGTYFGRGTPSFAAFLQSSVTAGNSIPVTQPDQPTFRSVLGSYHCSAGHLPTASPDPQWATRKSDAVVRTYESRHGFRQFPRDFEDLVSMQIENEIRSTAEGIQSVPGGSHGVHNALQVRLMRRNVLAMRNMSCVSKDYYNNYTKKRKNVFTAVANHLRRAMMMQAGKGDQVNVARLMFAARMFQGDLNVYITVFNTLNHVIEIQRSSTTSVLAEFQEEDLSFMLKLMRWATGQGSEQAFTGTLFTDFATEVPAKMQTDEYRLTCTLLIKSVLKLLSVYQSRLMLESPHAYFDQLTAYHTTIGGQIQAMRDPDQAITTASSIEIGRRNSYLQFMRFQWDTLCDVAHGHHEFRNVTSFMDLAQDLIRLEKRMLRDVDEPSANFPFIRSKVVAHVTGCVLRLWTVDNISNLSHVSQMMEESLNCLFDGHSYDEHVYLLYETYIATFIDPLWVLDVHTTANQNVVHDMLRDLRSNVKHVEYQGQSSTEEVNIMSVILYMIDKDCKAEPIKIDFAADAGEDDLVGQFFLNFNSTQTFMPDHTKVACKILMSLVGAMLKVFFILTKHWALLSVFRQQQCCSIFNQFLLGNGGDLLKNMLETYSPSILSNEIKNLVERHFPSAYTPALIVEELNNIFSGAHLVWSPTLSCYALQGASA